MLLEVRVRGWSGGKDGVETGSLGSNGGGVGGKESQKCIITGNEMGNPLIEEKGLINI